MEDLTNGLDCIVDCFRVNKGRVEQFNRASNGDNGRCPVCDFGKPYKDDIRDERWFSCPECNSFGVSV